MSFCKVYDVIWNMLTFRRHILLETEKIQIISIKMLFSGKCFKMIKYSLTSRSRGSFPDQLSPPPLRDEKPEVPFNSVCVEH